MACFERGRVRVELSSDVIERLLTDGQLCAADLRCLDSRSKRAVLGIVLDACRPAIFLESDRAEPAL
jgi:hypothetical protein